jgi:hypothetical protein
MDDRERQLAAEGATRRQVAIAGIAAGVLLLGGTVYGTLVVLAGLPTVGLIQGLAPALHSQVVAAVDPHAARVLFNDHHAAGLIFDAVLVALATLGMIPVLRYLYEATRFRLQQAQEEAAATPGAARGARLPRAALILTLVGAGGGAVVLLAAQIFDTIKAHDFVGQADRSHAAVNAALNSTAHVVLTSFGVAAQLALAFAYVMIPLNAMRAGLLTRFMGILGMVSGALSVFFPPLQVLQAFWLIAFGMMLIGRSSSPLPPAWETGEATPWPSQQQTRGRRGRQPAPDPEPVATVAAPAPARTPRPASPNASKKRKKRR